MSYEHEPQPLQTIATELPLAFSEANTLLVNVDPTSVDTTPILEYAEENNFTPKAEYHLTIIGARDVVESLREQINSRSVGEQNAFQSKLNNLTALLGNASLKEGQYHRISKSYDYGEERELRETIIQEAEIESIEEFYSAFGKLTGIKLGTPFPHVTLFTKGTSQDHVKGIGIGSAEVFETMEHEAVPY